MNLLCWLCWRLLLGRSLIFPGWSLFTLGALLGGRFLLDRDLFTFLFFCSTAARRHRDT